MPHKSPPSRRSRRYAEEAALAELDRIREPLMKELQRLRQDPNYLKGQPPHVCCTRRYNQMRISPLEARAIHRAFRRDSDLRRKLPAVMRRLRKQLEYLRDNDERQSFDCPLLDGTRCLVHRAAKPIGCAAWHPPENEAAAGGELSFTSGGWRAFAARDRVNDALFGPHWKLRVIPLWLKRVFAKELQRGDGGPGS